MTSTETQRFAQVVLAASRGEPIDFQCKSGRWTRIEKPNADNGMGWDNESTRYSLAVSPQKVLPDLDSYECHIDQMGLHIGCTDISFERVREIAKACREWQRDGKDERLKRFFVLPVTENNTTNCTYGYKCWREAEETMYGKGWRIFEMQEVLPGEDDL